MSLRHWLTIQYVLCFGHPCNGVIWMAVSHCLMWSIWRERNSQCFEDSERTIADLKLLFFKTLLDWMSIIGSHSIFLVYDLMDACNLCVWLFWSPAVYLVDSFLWLCIKFSLLIKKKKKKKNRITQPCLCHLSLQFQPSSLEWSFGPV